MLTQKIKAFTLIELIIVVSIIAVLSSLAYVSLSGETGHARDAKRQADLKTLENAVSMSNAQNRSLSYIAPVVSTACSAKLTQQECVSVSGCSWGSSCVNTVNGVSPYLNTNVGNIRVLRNSSLFALSNGFINSTILANIERDPYGSPYYGAFISPTQFQMIGTLENPTTKIPESFIVGSFKEGSIIDNILVGIDNDDRVLPVGNASQFIKGDIIEIDGDTATVDDISINKSVIIVTRSVGATTHAEKASIKIKTFATNASSLFCTGELEVNVPARESATTTLADLSFASNLIPDAYTESASGIILNNTYTCSSAGNIEHGKKNKVYDVGF